MQYLNICAKKIIQTPEKQKTIYQKIGLIKITDNGGWFLQLYQQPNTDFFIFPSNDNELPTIK